MEAEDVDLRATVMATDNNQAASTLEALFLTRWQELQVELLALPWRKQLGNDSADYQIK